jgi:hypothetical protein
LVVSRALVEILIRNYMSEPADLKEEITLLQAEIAIRQAEMNELLKLRAKKIAKLNRLRSTGPKPQPPRFLRHRSSIPK